MTILGTDVSHWQGYPDWVKVRTSGRDFVVLKATEGVGYTDPSFAVNRATAHAAGLVVGLYHFARAGDAAAEAAYFLRTVGALKVGEFLVLDWEVPCSNPPAWCKQWLDAVYAGTGVRPLIYMNQSAATGSNWSAVAKDYGLWLAKYDNSTAQPSVGPWSVAMKQFSDRGTVPGIAGTCDVDVFYGTAAQLLKYGKQAPPTPPPAPKPAPTPPESDLTPDQAQQLADIHRWIRGGDPNHDNIDLLWAALYGQDPPGNGNVILKAITDAQSQAVDPVALAKALLADDAAVAKLGKAIADNLQLSPRAAG